MCVFRRYNIILYTQSQHFSIFLMHLIDVFRKFGCELNFESKTFGGQKNNIFFIFILIIKYIMER